MNILERYRDQVIQEIPRALPEAGPLFPLVRYPLGLCGADGGPGPGVGGKLLRPSLTLLVCEALGGEPSAALAFAVALELVHNFSLVHDDIQDGDELRRGRPTVWKAFGVGQAINAGDALLILALQKASSAPLPEKSRLHAQEALLGATLRMIEGQSLDLAMEGGRNSVEAYTEMVRRKTGALFGCALELGAIAAGREDLAASHRELGEELGIAFQMQDDILGLWGDPQRTGKPRGSDLLRKKRTYPVILALERDPGFSAFLGPAAVDEALRALERAGARAAAEEAVRRRWAELAKKVPALPWVDWARSAFMELLSFLAEREV